MLYGWRKHSKNYIGSNKKPLLTFSHQEGHIAAALFSAAREDLFEKEFLAFHISGGTTEAVLAKGSTSSFAVKEAAKHLT